jgi:hypothetical protein
MKRKRMEVFAQTTSGDESRLDKETNKRHTS